MSAPELRPALDITGWLPFQGLRPGKLNFESIDLALDRLRQPTLIEDRLSVLQHVVNARADPARRRDGPCRVGRFLFTCSFALVVSLGWMAFGNHEWTKFFAGAAEQRGQPVMVDDRLLFYVENQYVYQWSTLPDGDDPPVFGRYENNEPWEREDIRVSEHLILACLFEAVMDHARFRASAAWLDEDRFAAIVEHIPPIAIGPWRWLGSRFFARNGAFMCSALNGEDKGKKHYSVWIGAKSPKPLRFLRPLLSDTWECAEIDWRSFLAGFLRNRMRRLKACAWRARRDSNP